MRKEKTDLQKGQAAVEFVFALLFLIALSMVLFQALHFELDVFNKMGILRGKSMERMHYNNQQHDHGFDDDSQTVSFKPLSDLTGYRVIFQTADQNMKYPDKRLSYKRGTAPALPGGLSTGIIGVAIGCIATLDHVESTSGNCTVPFEVINSALGAIP
jgi:hypothetical protein